MITKLRLSENVSLGDISTSSICDQPAAPGGDCNSEEPSSLEGMKSDDQCTSEHQWIGHSRQEWSGRKKLFPGLLASDDSCNAVDNKLREEDKELSDRRESIDDTELSFNGKIKPLEIDRPVAISSGLHTVASARDDGAMSCELIDATKGFERTIAEVEDDTNAARARKDRLNESFELLTKENSSWIHYKNEKSPDLFADDDNETDDANEDRNVNHTDREHDDPEEDADAEMVLRANKRSSGLDADFGLDCAVEDVSSKSDTIERVFLKRLQSSLSGVPPPPSLTYSNMGVESMLALYHSNVEQWWSEYRQLKSTPNEAATSAAGREGDSIQAKPHPECLSKPTHLTKELSSIGWPELMRYRAHGLHYNKSTVSEKMELLGLKYVERYIGAERSSSFNMALSPSSAKKRNQRMKMLNQSPGSRLSHLARRRAFFSSANLLNNSGGSGSSAGSIVSASRTNITTSALNRLNPFRLCNRQVLLDPKKSDNRWTVKTSKVKTPQRRSPALGRKSPRRRTPGSSAKKLSLARTSTTSAKPSQQLLVPATVESSKRALFLSPANGASSGARTEPAGAGSTGKQTDRSIFSEARMLKSKRSLFSPPRGTADDAGGPITTRGKEEKMDRFGAGTSCSTAVRVSMKRRRSPSVLEEDQAPGMSDERTEKIRRKESSALAEEDLTPRSLKFARSQSFCVGSQTVSRMGSQLGASDCAPVIGGKSLFRANSEITSEDGNRPVMMLTENHKKKLLWAVSQALKDKQVPTKHENFKQLATNLTRVVKRLFLEFNDQTISSTSEKLLRLANKHVFEVIQGKSVEDIYFREKTRILNARNLTKLQGYIAPDEYELRKLRRAGSMTSMGSSVDVASPFDSSLSASQTFLSQSSSIFSQGSYVGGSFTQLSTEGASGSVAQGRQLKAAASTGSVNVVGVGSGALVGQGGNLMTTALRENIDSELRQRSTQKQLSFSGKDQKNVSPYRADKGCNPVVGSMANANNKLLVGGAHNSSIMKAKRQISFE